MTGLLRLHRLFADEDRHAVPAPLAARVRHLALETWGDAGAEERQRVDALVQAELALRAEALFELDPAAHARTRQHLDDVTRRLGSTPHHSHWRRWTAVWLSARARRARRHAAAAEGRQRAAAEWRERCGAAVMAMFDIEVARARRAAAHAAADRPRIINQKETPHVTSRSTDVAPTSLEHVALLRAQIEADAAIVGSEHRQECRARAVSASTAAAEAGRRTGAMATIAQALDEAYANRVTPRLIVLLTATAACAIGISAEYAFTLATLPGMLDIDPTSWSGVAVAAVPVAALTAIEWGLVALFAGEIRPFQRSLGGGRPRGALVAALGVIAVATAGVLVLWMNLQMVLDLGEVRGAASLLATDALASLESLAQAQAIVDRTARVIAVVAALDTALLLLVLQEEGRHAWSAGMLSLRRRLAARRLQDARVTLQAATVENDIAGASLASAEQSAALLVTAYRTRALAELQARIDAASSARSAAEVFVDERLSRPPGASAPLTEHTLVH